MRDEDKAAQCAEIDAVIEALQQEAAWILMLAAIANAKRFTESKS